MRGQTKQKKSSRSSTVAGIVISSVRSTPRVRDTRPAAVTSPAGGAGDSASATGTAMADPWVERVVGQVGGEVGQDDDGGEDQHDALDERDVPVVDGPEQLVPDAGQPEDLF